MFGFVVVVDDDDTKRQGLQQSAELDVNRYSALEATNVQLRRQVEQLELLCKEQAEAAQQLSKRQQVTSICYIFIDSIFLIDEQQFYSILFNSIQFNPIHSTKCFVCFFVFSFKTNWTTWSIPSGMQQQQQQQQIGS